MKETLSIGLFGFGCVGQGLYRTITDNHLLNARITRIVIKNAEKERTLPADHFSTDPGSILNDPSISLVVELIDDAREALKLVGQALAAGKAVVTANKKMVAENLEELIRLQKRYERPVFYEGAVCGSIPIIQTLENYYISEELHTLEGIVNGSTNYILTRVILENKTYADALREAQENGFAESDPSLDVEGYDATFKLSILLRHALGIRATPDRLFRWGIDRISRRDIRFAATRGFRIKLLARGTLTPDGYLAYVAPHFVNTHDAFYHINNEFNGIRLHGTYAGSQLLTGKGAGSLPTGLAVLSDIVSYAANRTYHYRPVREAKISSTPLPVYLSYSENQAPDTDWFSSLDEHFVNEDGGYMIGAITLDRLRELSAQCGDSVNVIFRTPEGHESSLQSLKYQYDSDLPTVSYEG